MRSVAPLALPLVLLSACVCSGLQQKGNLSLAQKALQERDYQEALVQAEAVILCGDAEPGAQLQGYFVKAQILEQLDRKKEAAGLYAYVVHASPGSELGYLAKARAGDLGEICKVPEGIQAAP